VCRSARSGIGGPWGWGLFFFFFFFKRPNNGTDARFVPGPLRLGDRGARKTIRRAVADGRRDQLAIARLISWCLRRSPARISFPKVGKKHLHRFPLRPRGGARTGFSARTESGFPTRPGVEPGFSAADFCLKGRRPLPPKGRKRSPRLRGPPEKIASCIRSASNPLIKNSLALTLAARQRSTPQLICGAQGRLHPSGARCSE